MSATSITCPVRRATAAMIAIVTEQIEGLVHGGALPARWMGPAGRGVRSEASHAGVYRRTHLKAGGCQGPNSS